MNLPIFRTAADRRRDDIMRILRAEREGFLLTGLTERPLRQRWRRECADWGWPCISVRRGLFGFVAEAWIPEGWTLHRLPAELLRLALNRVVGRFVRFKISPGLVTVRGFRATEAREMAVCLAAELRERLDAPKSPPAAAPDPAQFVAVDVTPPSWQQARPPGQQ